uniref:Pseudouridine synthase I TruA alpha/beta domain-containing protein n=1 Tax=Timspurckia oligopyrenoides TaxID=708627 RepID=A0A7S0ZG47_9RHOD|mmetsp:Transcript_3972/g.6960  ORF Transcript_3972/g.6960 Transcript_3972/m.6960 type:complete len:448 (+) Transcript_3972:46-1389(+)
MSEIGCDQSIVSYFAFVLYSQSNSVSKTSLCSGYNQRFACNTTMNLLFTSSFSKSIRNHGGLQVFKDSCIKYCRHSPILMKSSESIDQNRDNLRTPNVNALGQLIIRSTCKKKVAILLGYVGKNYSGWQKNPNIESVEEALEESLHAAGLISDVNVGSLSKSSWTSCARTDKGVSAASQVVGMKIQWPRDLEFDCKVVRDQLAQCVPEDMIIYGVKKVVGSFNARTACFARTYEYLLPVSCLKDGVHGIPKLNEILANYIGTHSFHNFTKVNKISGAGLSRYMMNFEAYPLEIVQLDTHAQQFVPLRVTGQSFVLYQIRKMVSLALLVQKEWVCESEMKRCLSIGESANIPPAPAEGLFLHDLVYSKYNERFQGKSDEIGFQEFHQQRVHFKVNHIFPYICGNNGQLAAMEEWLDTTRDFLTRGDPKEVNLQSLLTHNNNNYTSSIE